MLRIDKLTKFASELSAEQLPSSAETHLTHVRTDASAVAVKRRLVERADLMLQE
jgi:hypothetical protein